MSTETLEKTSFYFSSIRGVKESVSGREGELQTNKTQRDERGEKGPRKRDSGAEGGLALQTLRETARQGWRRVGWWWWGGGDN